ncbi:DUF4422 domain-containing protein [Lacrimispora sp. BS-2]|uniref:DUF4422 domain-containing protein n=1 Tax=Lacrimispora sp. BS-2 TaxID=3151850 RepID=A0AAU7PQS0_9FIRM
MSEIKIFVTHTPNKEDYRVRNSLLVDVIAGSHYQIKPLDGDYVMDNTGDNISIKNKMYCELTTQYWAWKNVEADYYGFCHYRRFMSFANVQAETPDIREQICVKVLNDYTVKKYNLDDEILTKKFIEQYDCILPMQQDLRKLPTPKGRKKNVYDHFAGHDRLFMNQDDLNKLLEVINDLFPEYSDDAKVYMGNPYFWGFNCFVLKKELFNSLCEFEFGVLEELEKRIDLNLYNQQMTRIYGFMGEILSSIFFFHLQKADKSLRVANVRLIYFEDTKDIKPIYPVADSKKPIVFNIVGVEPYLFTVTIQSFLARVRNDIPYDVIILHGNLSDGYAVTFKMLFGNHENIRVSFIDTKCVFGNVQDLKSNKVDARLLLPWILTEYSQIICINWNTLFQCELEKIINMEIEPVCISGSRDIRMLGKVKGLDDSYELFVEKELGIHNICDLIDTDIIYMNLDKIRSRYTMQSLFQRISEVKVPLHFSEYANMLFEDRQVLDACLCVYYTESMKENNLIRQVPLFIFNEYNKAKLNPLVLSYSPDLIWSFESKDFIDKYWSLAAETGYYHKLIGYFEGYSNDNNKDINRGPYILKQLRGGIQCVKDHGVIYTFCYSLKKMFN